jgi:GT2 family glycosyltransferase
MTSPLGDVGRIGIDVEGAERRIVAVVLTHNAPESLERCLAAIADQTVPPDAVVVVDNASRPPVAATALTVWPGPVTLVRSETNTGPAGGYHQALGLFLDSDHLHAWVLDDDMRPQPQCLERLWEVASGAPVSAFVFPVSRQSDGSFGNWPSWCGFIVARQIVEAVGLPMTELFWWAEDTEYLQWRIPQAGYVRQVVHDAVVDHDGIRQGDGVPLWKYYYEARNMLYVHLHVKHRVGRYPRNLSKLLARAIVREDHGRLRRLGVIGRGLADGARGRLGIRYPVEPMQERSMSPGPGG